MKKKITKFKCYSANIYNRTNSLSCHRLPKIDLKDVIKEKEEKRKREIVVHVRRPWWDYILR